MNNHERAKAMFHKNAAEHAMTISLDNGLHRHIRFRNPKYSAYWFDLITWPGCLCINGDMGSFVFSRIEDMFSFFRERDGEINPDYWAEKIQATSRDGGHIGFSREKLIEGVRSQYKDFLTDKCSGRKDPAAVALWHQIEDEILCASSIAEANHSLNSFNFESHDGREFTFTDWWDIEPTDYTMRYLWCCYAIVWGINQYDRYKDEQRVDA